MESIFLEKSIRASFEVLKEFAQNYDYLIKSFEKGAGGDISIGADLLSEKIYAKHFLDYCNLDSEESGFIKASITTNKVLVLDSLDGSDNLKSGIPYYGASLALCEVKDLESLKKDSKSLQGEDRVLEAFVINFISLEVIYSNLELKQPLTFKLKSLDCVSDFIHTDIKELALPLKNYVVAPSCGVFERAHTAPEYVRYLKNKGFKFRGLGAAALSLAFAFRYKFVIMLEISRRYDVLAGLFISRDLYVYGNLGVYALNIPFSNMREGTKDYVVISSNQTTLNQIVGM
ncbi:hypothetical protein BKH43_05855 [Helicobacter sp. 13S00401-1]|uniref:hypothetical protein n=1 Tax=Helicobacter sp. 13S00401-1 TaxID=1905758 RepID=UPI000BA4ED66|nr:hypothetical protein [Helicobacter sp. 13S00401-1]PAF50133.1 hypothetical protein BKH43_05855 [Helicobacter sp. 13S00401-1]